MSKVLFQNSEGLLPAIQSVGCFFRSCLRIAEIETGKNLNAEEINELWLKALTRGYINQKLEIEKSAPIIDLAFLILGSNKRAAEVGIFKDGETAFCAWTWSYKEYQQFNYLIQKVHTINDHTHFRIVNKRGTVIFDPYFPSPDIAFIYYSILYHIS